MKKYIYLVLLFILTLVLACKKEKQEDLNTPKFHDLKIVQIGTGEAISGAKVVVRRAGFTDNGNTWGIGAYYDDSLFTVISDESGLAKFTCLPTDYLAISKEGYLNVKIGVMDLRSELEMAFQGTIRLVMKDEGLYPGIRNFLNVKVWSKAKLSYGDYPGTEYDYSDYQVYSITPPSPSNSLFLKCAAGIPNHLRIFGYVVDTYREFDYENIMVEKSDTAQIEFKY